MENQNQIVLNDLAKDALRESAKWSFFLSILGFIGIAFMVLFSLYFLMMTSSLDAFGFGGMRKVMGLLYFVLAGIYTMPVLYLYRYATGMKNALLFQDSDNVAFALENLKSHHKFLGISMIVMISLYIVMIVGGILFAASMASGY